MASTRIVKKEELLSFQELVDKYKNDVKVDPHALFRLSEAQRKVYKEDSLIAILVKEKPASVGIQQNGRYAAFYRRKEGYLRMVLAIHQTHIEIITFFATDNLPNI